MAIARFDKHRTLQIVMSLSQESDKDATENFELLDPSTDSSQDKPY